jgi:hypothetical protein
LLRSYLCFEIHGPQVPVNAYANSNTHNACSIDSCRLSVAGSFQRDINSTLDRPPQHIQPASAESGDSIRTDKQAPSAFVAISTKYDDAMVNTILLALECRCTFGSSRGAMTATLPSRSRVMSRSLRRLAICLLIEHAIGLVPRACDRPRSNRSKSPAWATLLRRYCTTQNRGKMNRRRNSTSRYSSAGRTRDGASRTL